MFFLKTGIAPDRLFKIKTCDDADWRFAHILLIRMKTFSPKLTPFATDNNNDRNDRIIAMQSLNPETHTYEDVNIESLRSRNIFSTEWGFRFIKEGV